MLGGGNIKYNKSVFRNLALISQVGISIITPIFLCLYIGYKLDKYFGTSLIILFLILGVISGCMMGYKLVMSMIKKDAQDDKKQELENRKNINKKEVSRPKIKSRVFKEEE